MKRQQPEKAEQRAILDLFGLVKAEVWVLGHPSPADGRSHRGTGQTPGLPDLVAFVPTVTYPSSMQQVWVECKAPAGRLSAAQRGFQLACRRANVSHVVGGVDAMLAWLRARGHRV